MPRGSSFYRARTQTKVRSKDSFAGHLHRGWNQGMNQVFQKDTIHRREDRPKDKVSEGCTQSSDSTHKFTSGSFSSPSCTSSHLQNSEHCFARMFIKLLLKFHFHCHLKVWYEIVIHTISCRKLKIQIWSLVARVVSIELGGAGVTGIGWDHQRNKHMTEQGDKKLRAVGPYILEAWRGKRTSKGEWVLLNEDRKVGL